MKQVTLVPSETIPADGDAVELEHSEHIVLWRTQQRAGTTCAPLVGKKLLLARGLGYVNRLTRPG